MYVTGSTKISFTDYDNFKPVLLIWQFSIQSQLNLVSKTTNFSSPWIPNFVGFL